MQLAACTYLGDTTRKVRLPGLGVSYTRYEPMQEQPWHVHENPTFFVHLHGDHVDGSPERDLTQPRLTATYHPGREYHRCRIGATPACGLNFEVTDAWLEGCGISPRRLGRQRILDTLALRDAGLRAFADLLVVNSDSTEFEEIALQIAASFCEEDGHCEPKAIWLPRAEERLRAEFRSRVTLRDLAEEAAVHPVYFARAFRARYGVNVSDYVQKLRLQFAADLVLSGTPLGVAAAEAGFADQFHFSRQLKRHYRIAPSDLKSYRIGSIRS